MIQLMFSQLAVQAFESELSPTVSDSEVFVCFCILLLTHN